jgi:hypothetical protein
MCGLLLSGTARSQTAAAAFYSQSLNCGGIGVRAPAAVDPKALETACKRIDMMLEAGPDIRKRLAAAHAELHIIGQDQPVAEAPEYRSKIGKTGFGSLGEMTGLDARMRGLGGLWSVCGEENLLDPDRYKGGSDICVHVFAHTIMNFGLTESARKRVGLYYAMAIKAQLWKDAYAAADPFEYWAELSMWYFGGHSSQGGEAPKGDGPEALNAYDPYGYSMLYYLYRGKG